MQKCFYSHSIVQKLYEFQCDLLETLKFIFVLIGQPVKMVVEFLQVIPTESWC